jgi:hypothetical protein
MPFGEYQNDFVIAQSDTAELRAYTYNPDKIPYGYDDIIGATWRIRIPDEDGTTIELPGEIEEDGAAYASFPTTEEIGTYTAVCQFTLESGEKRTERRVFRVEDPFATEPVTGSDVIVDAVWLRLEDCFDSTEGGPWLRDVTLRYFDRNKIAALVPFALTRINLAPPMTNVTLDYFVTIGADGLPSDDVDQAILVQGMLLETIRHLMRSYVEQPQPQGAQVVYEDRRDYLQRWQSIYQLEQQEFLAILALWKRQFLGLGRTALLIHSKAGRQTNVAPRTWQARRGYW